MSPVVVWLLVAAVGALELAVSTLAARRPVIGTRERRVFLAINRGPSWAFALLWPPMQLGNLVVGLLVGLGAAAWDRSLAVAFAVVVATALKLVVERVVRHQMADWLAVRQRPGTSQPDAVIRGDDVPRSGPSFPSGHVMLAWAIACVAATALPVPLAVVLFAVATTVGVGRIHVGAHNPLDATAGMGAGLVIGGVLAALLV